MPLVPLSVVSRWYQRDSWVYKLFSFTYQNPLWKKPVPKGYSLCPYFWQSVIGGLLIVPLLIGLFTVSMILSWPIRKLYAAGWLGKITVGIGYFLVLCLFFECYLGALKKHEGTAAFSLFQFIIVGWSCFLYIIRREGDPEFGIPAKPRCKVEYYIALSALLGLVACSIAYPLTLAHLLFVIIHFFYHYILTPIGHFLSWIPYAIWVALKWTIRVLAIGWYWWVIPLFSALFGYFLYWIGSLPIFNPPVASSNEKPEDKIDVVESLAGFAAESAWEWPISHWSWRRWERVLRKYLFTDLALVQQAEEAVKSGNYNARITVIQKALKKYFAHQLLLDARCQRVSALVERLLRPLSFIFWKPIHWTATQLWTFACLIVELIKARKQGWCPYLQFKDGPNK